MSTSTSFISHVFFHSTFGLFMLFFITMNLLTLLWSLFMNLNLLSLGSLYNGSRILNHNPPFRFPLSFPLFLLVGVAHSIWFTCLSLIFCLYFLRVFPLCLIVFDSSIVLFILSFLTSFCLFSLLYFFIFCLHRACSNKVTLLFTVEEMWWHFFIFNNLPLACN